MRSLKKIKRSKDGGMPFVAIAAVLLILGSAYGVMISQAKDIEETADNIITELGSLDSAIVGTKTSVERGLGELIFGISTDPEGGSLENRAEMFKKQSGEWMRKNFPCADKGVSVSIKDFDFVLEAENLKMVSSDAFTDGFMPSYLKAAGHYTATFVSGSGTVQRVTEISTDGTCALPLVAEVGSLFESMVSDEGSALSQMMSHQLTSLAQYRVLNGYGALAEYGSMGTMSIITSDDVRAAYESSKRVLEMLVFRCPSDGIDADLEKIDLADMFVSEDGFIEIDLSAVYSQALISIIDDLVLRWFDYFYGNTIIDIFDFFTDAFGNFLDSLVGFFTGKNEFTAAPYIERVMSDNGLDMNLYRHLFSGKTASIRTDSIDLIVGNSSVTVPSLTVSVDYPSVDLMAWGGISKFKSNYREDTNDIRELIRNIINSAAVGIGTSKALGTIRLPIDPSDDVSFMESLFDGVDAALDRGRSEVERFMTSAINEQRISDPFYAAIFKVVSEDREHIYCAGIFKENIRSSITASLALHFENCGIVYDENDLDKAAAVLLGGDDVRRTISFYDEAVEGCLSGLSALTEVPAGRSGTFKDICIAMFGGGALFVDFATNVPAKIRALCAEAVKNSNINGYSGPVDLPGTDSFILAGSGGKVSTEKLSISSSSAPKIQVRGPGDNLSDCIHYIGFNEVNGASHATAFSVSLEDDLEYTLRSSGILETAMDVSDSVYKGSAKIRLNIKIVVASGWELAGVKKYTPSNTALGDAWNALIKLMFPLLEPLREILMMMTDVFTILCGPMMEMLKCVASIVEKLFRAMMEPLEVMKRFVEEQLEKVFNFAVEKAIEGVEWIVGIDMSKQTVGFSYMGFTVTFTTKLSTLASNTKTLIIVTISKEMDNVTISGSLTVKQRGSGSSKELLLTGSATIKGSDWSVSADIDPLMKSSGQMLFVYGYVKGVSFDLIFPDLVQYQHAEFALSDIPPIAMVLSNIPSPIPGFKISLDAGIDLKYNIPFKGGILINEFELNPPGEDRDNEWVEVINMTKSRVDLDG
ncbi:MAG: hypothetical protein FWG41_05410, partial [Methanomassiliicoccaceae archaeon]|nr:hypothetical protein [Methanomassiliicoccaceae archaeon]